MRARLTVHKLRWRILVHVIRLYVFVSKLTSQYVARMETLIQVPVMRIARMSLLHTKVVVTRLAFALKFSNLYVGQTETHMETLVKLLAKA